MVLRGADFGRPDELLMAASADFEAFAKVALGTDDPERIAALKEAIMACMGDEEAGEYDEPTEGGDVAATLFGGLGKK